jgi:aminoglycoside phosphotransferase (APT) family kinase protein
VLGPIVGTVRVPARVRTIPMVSDAPSEMQRSSRDLGELRLQLESWLAGRLPAGASPSVGELHNTSANGMSSETILFTASWTEDGAARTEELVARIAPDVRDVPVFPSYDLDQQFHAMRLAGELSDVPVPAVCTGTSLTPPPSARPSS